MFATEFPVPTIPSWVNEVTLPKYPHFWLAGYALLGLGVLLLLIGYFTPIKKLPTLFAALALLAYYPLAYAAHWFLFRYNKSERAAGEPSKIEDFFFHHTHVLDWSIQGVCAFFALLFVVWTVWATVRKRRRQSSVKAMASADNPFAAPAPPPPASAKPAAPRVPAAPQGSPARKVVKKPPAPPSSDNPFKFS